MTRTATLVAVLCLLGCSETAPEGSTVARDAAPDALGVDPGSWTDAGDAAPSAHDSGTPTSDATPTPKCTKVAHIGDSLTAYTIDPLQQAYSQAGYSAQIDAFGGRAVFEKLPDDPHTGKQAAEGIAASGFDGCWVIALGTNDTANVAAGANLTRAARIDAMMEVIDPSAQVLVMWVNTYTTKTSGYWQNDNMVLWNQALLDAQARWANLRVFDWAAIAQGGSAPFVDGIHHDSQGYAVRNAAIVQALVQADN